MKKKNTDKEPENQRHASLEKTAWPIPTEQTGSVNGPPAAASGNSISAAGGPDCNPTAKQKGHHIMEEILTYLKSIAEQVNTLTKSLAYPPLDTVLQKQAYSCREVASLSKVYGIKKYAQFTIRQACAGGRVEGTYKINREWSIPRKTVKRILTEGLSPKLKAFSARLSA